MEIINSKPGNQPTGSDDNPSKKTRAEEAEDKKKKEKGVGFLPLMGYGVFFIVTGLYIYMYIMQGVFGNDDYMEYLTPAGFMSLLEGEEKIKIGILYSQYTENLLPPGNTSLNDNIVIWKRFLDQYKLTYTVLADSDIEKGHHKDYALLILPSSKSLSDLQYRNLKSYIDRGGSIFATAGTASFTEKAKWRGWIFFNEIFGVKFRAEIPHDVVTRIHTLRGGLPITSNIPAGYPLKIATWDRPIAVEVLEPRAEQASFWYNYRFDEGLVREGLNESAGIVFGTYGKGRFVWMGFDVNSVIGRQEDYVNFDKLFNNSVNWLLRLPIAYVKDWPGDYKAAALITPTVSEQPANIANLFPILSSENIKANFFVDPSVAETYPDLIRRMAGYGTIGAIGDIGFMLSINDTINKLNDLTTQFNKVKSAKDKLSAISNTKVYSFLPANGLLNDDTYMALIRSGYRVVLTDSLTDRSVPRVVIKGDSAVIALTKTARDDYEVIRDYGLYQQEFQLYTYREDIERVLFERGLYIFKMHTEYQCLPENVWVTRNVIKLLKEKQFWMTDINKLYDWWVQRNRIEIRVLPRSSSRVAVVVSNPGSDLIKEFTLSIELESKSDNFRISSEIIGTQIPKFNFNAAAKKLDLYIKDLKAGQSRSYLVDFERIDV